MYSRTKIQVVSRMLEISDGAMCRQTHTQMIKTTDKIVQQHYTQRYTKRCEKLNV